MFKNTNHFFRKVFEGKVTFTEQDNYIESISYNYDLKKLKTLSFDLTIFISNKIEELESGIDNDQIAYAFERYKELGLEVPYKDVLNPEYLLAKIANLPLVNIPEKNKAVDLIQMFYSRELFNLKRLQYKIRASYNEQLAKEKQELEKKSNLKVLDTKDIDSRNLTANQRALIMVYNDNTIVTRREHGNDLYNKFTKWVKSQTRTADPDTTKLVLENKIKLFESIIPFLLEENKQKAIDEIKTLKLHLLKY